VEKIKTIGDAYMAAAGLPGSAGDHIRAAADLTLAMRAAVREAGEPWQVRIGLHAGPVVAGVIGTSKFVYDLWGDAVNVASRLETTAPPDTIQVSESIDAALGGAFELEPHEPIELKGKGSTKVYFLLGRV
jgi:class 3 adenylate cyclase